MIIAEQHQEMAGETPQEKIFMEAALIAEDILPAIDGAHFAASSVALAIIIATLLLTEKDYDPDEFCATLTKSVKFFMALDPGEEPSQFN